MPSLHDRTPAPVSHRMRDRRPAPTRRRPGTAHERGAVLVNGLIMLGVMSLLVASMIRTSILELRIGGANQAALETFANAESALLASIAANAGRWAPGFTNLPVGTAGAPVPVVPLLTTVQNGTVDEPVIRQIACGNPAGASSLAAIGQNNAVAIVVFDIVSTARSLLGGVQRLGAGMELQTPGGAC
jgi:hypothetical protein